MPARRSSQFVPKISPQSAFSAWPQQFLLFALLFAALMLLHAPLLRLPYFWDEAGYYIPAARDLFLTGSLIPQSTPSNAHPPLVMAWLAVAWRVFGYSTLVTRTAMLALSAFALLGMLRLASSAAVFSGAGALLRRGDVVGHQHSDSPHHIPAVAWATTILLSLYPVYFTQSSMALVDLPAAGFTFWGLAAYLEDHPWKQMLWFSLAALTKETAILAPVALFCWQMFIHFVRKNDTRVSDSIRQFLPPVDRKTLALHLLAPVVLLVIWYGYHYLKTDFLLGNPEFYRYNVAATLDPWRVPLALGMRLWQLLGYFGLYLLTLAGVLALLRPAQKNADGFRPRIAIWILAPFLSVLLAYLAFMSVVGGAVLARYMLPVLPLVMLAWVSTLWRRVRYWELIVAAVAVAFVAGLFVNPSYGFSLEDNLAYRDYIVLHVEAERLLAMQYSRARVLTAWPASDEISRPWLGYVARPFPVVRMDDFSEPQVELAARARGRFDVALVFSTKYRPPHPLFEDWEAWQHIKQRFFGFHRDLKPEEIARRLRGTISYHEESDGQWIAVIVMEK